MDERVFGNTLLGSVILVLTAVLWIAVSPCLAIEPSYTLQQLFDGQPIQIDNLKFSEFKHNDNPPRGESFYQQIFVEIVGAGTLSPGLKFFPNPDIDPSLWSTNTQAFTDFKFSYVVSTDSDLPLIKGSSLTLAPGKVESSSGTVRAMVQDRRGTSTSLDDLEVKRALYSVSTDDGQTVVDTLEATSTFSGEAAVYPDIWVRFFLQNEGDQASIKGFAERFWLVPPPGVPPPGAPTANAGPDLMVADVAKLDGSDSEGNIDSYKWVLIPRDRTLPTLTDDAMNPVFENLGESFYDVTLTVTEENGYTATDTMLLAASGPAKAPAQQADADLKVWGLKLKKYKRCKWSFARMYGTFNFPEVDLDHNGTVNAEVTIKLLGAKSDGGDFLVKGETACKVRDHKYKFVIRK